MMADLRHEMFGRTIVATNPGHSAVVVGGYADGRSCWPTSGGQDLPNTLGAFQVPLQAQIGPGLSGQSCAPLVGIHGCCL